MNRFFARLLPRSITTQVASIVAVSVLVGVVIFSSVVFLVVGPPPDDGRSTIARIAEFTLLMRRASTPGEAELLLTLARRNDRAPKLVAIDQLTKTDASPSVASWLSISRLAASEGIEILTSLHDPTGPPAQIITRISDVDALVFDGGSKSDLWPLILTPTALLALIVAVSMVLLSLYAVRWVTAPLAAVARAAISFGHSPQHMGTLIRTGPEEIAQVADALNEMSGRIRNLLDDRTRMLAAISHDLRTPLTRLRLRVERVKDQELRAAMLVDISKTSQMLNDTLEFLRDDARSEQISQIDLPSLLRTISSEFFDTGHPVSYVGPSRLAHACRPRALSRAVTNIVENAVKHCKQSVTITLAEYDPRGVSIAVEDDGHGIPEELRKTVFEPFFKVDTARGNAGNGGFGLGLSIARDIVARHDGVIEIEPAAPNGLRVVISLPHQSQASVTNAEASV
jgi:signal transduction histidine kinase